MPLIYLSVVFAGLVSIIDTQLLSSANIVGNDVHDAAGAANPVQWGRYAMVGLAALGIALANIPGLDLQQIFVFGKSLTLTFFAPIIMGLLGGSLLTRAGFFGGGPQVIAIAVGIQIIGSGIVAYLVSNMTRKADASA